MAPWGAPLRQGFEGQAGVGGGGGLVRRERVTVEDEDALVIEGKLRGLPGNPGRIEGLGVFLLRPAEEGRHADRFHCCDIVGRSGRGRDVEDSFPHAVEAEEEFDFLGAGEGVADLHEALAARAEEGILAPDASMRLRQRGRRGRALRAGGGETVSGGPWAVRVVPHLGLHPAALVEGAAAIVDSITGVPEDLIRGVVGGLFGGERRGGNDHRLSP